MRCVSIGSSDPTRAANKPLLARMQKSALVLLVSAGTLNYFDRSALAIASPLIREDFGLTLAQTGLLLSAFLWAYALAQIPGGALVDRFGARRVLGLALALWSTAQAAAGFVSGLGQFALARASLGLGEAPIFPCATSVTRSWYPTRRRALVTGLWNCVSTLGPTLAPPLLTAMMLALGWRPMFILLGIVGIVLAALWYGLYRDPDEVLLSSSEQAQLGSESPGVQRKPSFSDWRQLFGFSQTWGLVLGYFGVIYMLWLFSSWLPGYLEIERHMSVRTTGWIAAIPFAFGVVGSVGGGWLADRRLAAGHAAIATRKNLMIIALLGTAIFTLGASAAAGDFTAVSCICGALLCNGCCTTMNWSLVGELAPAHCTASLGGITNFGGYLGGALAPLTTGLIVQHSGSFTIALVVAAAIAALSALALYLLIPLRPIVLGAFAAPASV